MSSPNRVTPFDGRRNLSVDQDDVQFCVQYSNDQMSQDMRALAERIATFRGLAAQELNLALFDYVLATESYQNCKPWYSSDDTFERRRRDAKRNQTRAAIGLANALTTGLLGTSVGRDRS